MRAQPKRRPIRGSVSLVVLACLGLAGCSHGPELVSVPELRQLEARTPVVFVPGILGTKLRERDTGRVLWGRGVNVIGPRDGGYSTALPITAGDGEPTAVEAFEVVDAVSLAGIRRVVYGALADLLEGHGYRLGDLAAPRPGDSAFFFAYDWRHSNVVAARQLREGLERLREVRGDARLPVNLICQSNGAHVCRYFLKYGGAALADAEAGRASPPPTIDVRRLVLVGTANGGSLRSLRELDRGRRYLKPVGRRWRPEAAFTFRALFQDLPAYSDDLFLDENGEKVAVDVFDPASWRRYGWSIYRPAARRRLAAGRRPDLFGDAAERERYLERMLDEARRFQRLLARGVAGFGDTRYYLLQSGDQPTPRRAVLLEDGGVWRTLFTGDPELERDPELAARAGGLGDGHAVLESQHWLSPQERAALADEPFRTHGKHFAMVLKPATQRKLLEVLGERPGPAIAGDAAPAAVPALSSQDY